jgi:hypothetical protein|nr:MAG TPA: hypothetical protein [Microviridae sp.]
MDKILTRAEILYQNQRSESSVSREIPLDVNGIVTGASVVDASLTDTIQPINPVTGWRDNAISRLMSPNTPSVERELILSSLAKQKGYNSPKELSDDDLLEILPSRYSTDPVELERFKEFVDELRNVEDNEPTALVEPAPVEPVSPPAE